MPGYFIAAALAPMPNPQETWTRAHDLALIFIALAYGTDQELNEDELAVMTDVLQGWREDFPIDEVQDVVMEAIAVYVGEDGDAEVMRTMHTLKGTLSLEERGQALEDVVRIAEADGIVLTREQNLISLLAEVWGLKEMGDDLLEQTRATHGDRPWSLLHDMGLLYLVVAHSADNTLKDEEITAMIEHMQEWAQDLDESAIRKILREALAFYSTSPDEPALNATIQSVNKTLPVSQRLVLLNDLVHLAEVDGTLTQNEEEIIASLSSALGIGVRLNGQA